MLGVTIRGTHEAVPAGTELRACYTIAPVDASGSLILQEPVTHRLSK